MTALLKATNGALMRPPLLGLMAWATVLLWTPLAHALMVLEFSLLGNVSKYLLSFLIGLAFAAGLVWFIRRRQAKAGAEAVMAT